MSEKYVTAVLRAIHELLATGHRRVLVLLLRYRMRES